MIGPQTGFCPESLVCGNFQGGQHVGIYGAAVNDDAQLIDDTLAGNRAAFGELVRRYEGRLFNTLMHMVGSREEAEDVSQEAFVQAFLKLDSFRGAQRVLHLAVPNCLQLGGQPQTAQASGSVDGSAPRTHGRGT